MTTVVDNRGHFLDKYLKPRFAKPPSRLSRERLPMFRLILVVGEVNPYEGNLVSFTKRVKVLEIAVGAVLATTRFSLVRISIQDLVADRKPY